MKLCHVMPPSSLFPSPLCEDRPVLNLGADCRSRRSSRTPVALDLFSSYEWKIVDSLFWIINLWDNPIFSMFFLFPKMIWDDPL